MKTDWSRRFRIVSLVLAVGAAAGLADRAASVMVSAGLADRLRALPGLRVGSAFTDAAGNRLILRDVGFAQGTLRVTLGQVDLPAPRPALLGFVQPAEAKIGVVHAHDIRIQGKDATISIPDIEAHNATLGSTEIAALFNPHDKEPTEARVARFSFSLFRAPTITITPALKPGTKPRPGFTIHDVVLSDGVAGHIASMQAGGITSTRTGDPDDTASLDTGRIAIAGLDLPLAIRIQTGSRTDAGAALKPVFDSFSIEAIRLTGDRQAAASVGAIESRAVRARPPLLPFTEFSILAGLNPGDRTNEERQKFAAAVADLATSFAVDHFEMRQITIQAHQSDDTETARLGRFAIEGYQGLTLHSLGFDQLAMETKVADLSVASAAIDDLDQSAALEVLRAKDDPNDPAAAQAAVQKLLPKLSDVEFKGIHVQTAAQDGPGNSADGQAIVFDVPTVALKVSHSEDGTTTDMASHAEIVYAVAASTPSPQLQGLVKAGFDHFEIAFDQTLHLDPGHQTAEIGGGALAFKDLGTLTYAGALSNVSPDVISPDKAKQAEAMGQMKLQRLDLGYLDAGLADKVFRLMATSAGTSVPLFKAELIGQANVAVLKTFGQGPTTDQLNQAVAAFINTPKRFDLSIATEDGIDFKTLAAAHTPQELLPKVSITAAANR